MKDDFWEVGDLTLCLRDPVLARIVLTAAPGAGRPE